MKKSLGRMRLPMISPVQTMSNSGCERCPPFGDHRSARSTAADILYDHRPPIDDREGLAEALDARPDRRRRTQIEDYDMVLGMVDDLVERKLQLDLPPAGQSAQEDRQLHPFHRKLA